ncbi:response regulator transcription factor [Massilia yuzhufengensis]|uniref:Two-component system, OmpR family, response regulator QseB n=1 Tax=Massilia yuzhufengensis TaxID=1164594 RepID=A0A1I1RAB9_9BURK|nr:response regulator transcription factor [Massilia yuzhufengensis]SFD27340.1 two-component system, OmpR family, response regulator QseB [Massilia yuzhufengensis]
MRLLLIEDDELLASGLKLALRRAHYQVEHVGDGHAALAALRDNPFDLAVLDLGLPGLDGTQVLQALRDEGNGVPVLILSARDAIRDRILGLDLGADDYLVKPFELDELLARLRVLARRRQGRPVNRIALGALVLDLDRQDATWRGEAVELQRFEFMLLRHMAEQPQRVFNRAQLEEALYGWGEGAESNTIDVHVHHLRRKLDPGVVKTIRGVGYRLGDLQP